MQYNVVSPELDVGTPGAVNVLGGGSYPPPRAPNSRRA